MGVLDICIISLLLVGFVKGFMKGFVVEIVSILSLILGIYCAINFSNMIGNYLSQHIEVSATTLTGISYTVTFIIVVILISILGKIFTKVLKMVALGFVNKILGGVFGMAKYILIMAIAAYFLNYANQIFHFIAKDTLTSSGVYTLLLDLGDSTHELYSNTDTSEVEKIIPKGL